MREILSNIFHIKINHIKLITYCMILLMIGFASMNAAPDKYIYVPKNKVIALVGVIKKIHAFGPPWFGEDGHKQKKLYWVLIVNHKIKIKCNTKKMKIHPKMCGLVGEIELYFPILPRYSYIMKRANDMINKKVILVGVLHKSFTAATVTSIYMDVALIVKYDKSFKQRLK